MKPFAVLSVSLALLAACSKSGTQAPAEFKVRFDTSKGPFVVDVHREWAPRGADRFYELVKGGFYDDARFFRIVPGFVVQWGIHKDPRIEAQWRPRNIPDDPVRQSNLRGYVSYATDGPNTRTTQLFINLANNARLDARGFSPFGQVIDGMNVVDSLYSGYGESPNQDFIESQGNAYLQSKFPQLDYIRTTRIE
jgi:peptidyl-prolyl cis-trans isomerase A (cyclophilin A)